MENSDSGSSLSGQRAGDLSDWEAIAIAAAQILARIARARLGRSSIPLTSELALAAVTGPVPPECCTVGEVINELLRVKARGNRSDTYLAQLVHCFNQFNRGRSRRPLGSVTTDEMERWLDSLKIAPRTRKGKIQYLRLLYTFAQRRGYVERNPALALEVPYQDPKPDGVHTPDQVRLVLAAARKQGDGVAKAVAVRYFAGLRSSEMERLDPDEEIRLAERRIEITAVKSKTRRRRFVTIQENLARWLELEDPIPGDLEKRVSKAGQAAKVEWPQNVTRHSFCSYHLAHWQNAGKTALEAGHSEQMLFAHYRDLVTPQAAAEFWGIVP